MTSYAELVLGSQAADIAHPAFAKMFVRTEFVARQGVLLLNTSLTVRQGEANSHQKSGWPRFTDAIIRAVSARREPVVFVLWGGPAQKKEALIDAGRHAVIKSPHPSPLSAHQGFFGSQPFTRANAALRGFGRKEIAWQLPEAAGL